jgi:hypothetical protein
MISRARAKARLGERLLGIAVVDRSILPTEMLAVGALSTDVQPPSSGNPTAAADKNTFAAQLSFCRGSHLAQMSVLQRNRAEILVQPVGHGLLFVQALGQ